jgi:hypothetical protein
VSVLDERIRRIATEVSAGLADGLPGSSDRVAELERQVAELTDRVAELEKTATTSATKRATRAKTTEITA